MYFAFSPEQEEFRESVHAFLAKRASTRYVRLMYDDPRGTSAEVWQGLVDLGIPSVLVPEQHGGLGLGLVDIGVALEELGAALHPGPYFSSAVVATLALLAVGGDDAGTFLAPMAAGDRIATLALYEPLSRYQWATPSTTAKGSGDDWAVTGTKAHVADAAAADTILVVAQAPDGLGLFAVDRANATSTPEAVLDGSRKQSTVELVNAPATRIGSGDATVALAAALDKVLVAFVTDGLGTMQRALDITAEYAKDRMQFGKVIGSFQAVQHLCVDMYCDVEKTRSLAYYGLWAADDTDADETRRAGAMAKAFASDAFARVGATAIQVHGGIGVTWEHDIGLYYKRCLSLQSGYGDAREHYELLAQQVVDGEHPGGATAR